MERARAVCGLVAERKPHVVYLQEVVGATWDVIVGQLSEYQCYRADGSFPYYPILCLLKCQEIRATGSLDCVPFPQSTMGRHLLQLPVTFDGLDLQLMTSHLESTKDHGVERKNQFSQVFKIVEKLQLSRVCIFGGDLNIRDKEVAAVSLAPDTVDVWEACGSIEEHRYTWDTGANTNLGVPYKSKLRFDRIYLSPEHSPLKPSSFSLVGKECLPGCRRFPSDHWGVWTEFKLTWD